MSETAWRRIVPIMVPDLMARLSIAPWHACGIVGNGGEESGKFTALQERSPWAGAGGLGWWQWTGPRRKTYLTWCEQHGLPYWTYAANIGYLCAELTGQIPGFDYRKALRNLRQTRTVRDAAIQFEKDFEKAGVPALATRIRYANEAWSLWRASQQSTPVAVDATPIPVEPTPMMQPPKPLLKSGTILSAWGGAAAIIGTVLTAAGFQPASLAPHDLLIAGLSAATALAVTLYRARASSPIQGTEAARRQAQAFDNLSDPPLGPEAYQAPVPDGLQVGRLPLDHVIGILAGLNDALPQLMAQAARAGLNVAGMNNAVAQNAGRVDAGQRQSA